MRHYFLNSTHSNQDYFTFNEKFNNMDFKFNSCTDVFSKNEVDYGSKVLIETVIKHKDKFSGKVLDVGCGYGAISIILSKFLKDCSYTLVDVNKTALKLAKENIELNKCDFIDQVLESDVYNNVTCKFNHIVSNPPIKTGKQVLLNIVNDSINMLENNGTITLVIKKNYGADSTKKLLIDIFGNCEVLRRDKGFYILHSIKNR